MKKDFIPNSCIDVLYDYRSLLKEQPLCRPAKHTLGQEVAIIGAGHQAF